VQPCQETTCDWQPVTLESLLDGKPRNGYSPRAVEYDTPVKSLTLTATTTGRFRPEHSSTSTRNSTLFYLWLQPGEFSSSALTLSSTWESARSMTVRRTASFIRSDDEMPANASRPATFLHYGC